MTQNDIDERVPGDAWRPTCSREMLVLRNCMLQSIRRSFDNAGYLEVQTPLLSTDVVIDAHIDPITVSEFGRQLFLQTSPEAAMKRLLAAGSGSIYQITHAFRSGEAGPQHNPEFTMLEWYGAGDTWLDQLKFMEQLLHQLVADLLKSAISQSELGALLSGTSSLQQPYAQVTYEEAFARVGYPQILDRSAEDLHQLCRQTMGREFPNAERDELLNLLFAELVESTLGTSAPEFLCDFPASQAALAEFNPEDDRTARRFELYVHGLEISNGYQELTDATTLSIRQETENARRHKDGRSLLPGPARLIGSMKSGLPPCSGVALGFDRLVMAVAATRNLPEVLPFPLDRA